MKHYSAERKAAVLQKILPPSSLSVAELARQEGISDVTLYHWRKQAMASGEMSAVTKKAAEGWPVESKLAAVVETALLSEVELSEYCWGKELYPDSILASKFKTQFSFRHLQSDGIVSIAGVKGGRSCLILSSKI